MHNLKLSTWEQRGERAANRKVQLSRRALWKIEAEAYPCARTEADAARTAHAITQCGGVPKRCGVVRSTIMRRCVDFALFAARKRHSAALLVGNGPSANLVTAENAQAVQQHFDVWATNMFFPHHHLTPDFHHVEIKGFAEHFWYDQFDEHVRKRYQAQCTLMWGMHEFDFAEVEPPKPIGCAPVQWRPGELRQSSMEAHPDCYTNCPRCLRRVLNFTRVPFYIYDDLAFGPAERGKVDFSLCPTHAMDEVEALPVSDNPFRSGLLAKRCHASITTVISMIIRLQ